MRDRKKRLPADDNIIVMPDIYAKRFEVKELESEAIEPVAKNDDLSLGFDPYDTARLYRKKES